MSTPNKTDIDIVVYFDSSCVFCARSLDYTQKQLLINFQRKDLSNLNIEIVDGKSITTANLYDAMVVWTSRDNSFYYGYYGFHFLYLNYHKSKIIRQIIKFASPIFGFAGPLVYKIIANNRKIAGCDSSTCNLHRKTK